MATAFAEHLCVGLWTSKINGGDNGFIIIRVPPNPATGEFTGQHFVPNTSGGFDPPLDIQGLCQHPDSGGARPHFIQFQEVDANRNILVYAGEIVPDNTPAARHKVPRGVRQPFFFSLDSRRLEARADDEWMAEKVT